MRARTRPVSRRLAAAVGVALVYAVLYRLVVASSSFSASLGTPFWPAAGFTLALLLLRPRREWPLYLGVVFVTETALDIHADFGVAVSPFMGLANTAEPLVAALLLQRWLGKHTPDLSALRDLGLFLLAGGVLGPALAAAIGSFGPLAVAGDPVWPRLPRWFVGDALGAVTIAPVLIATVRLRRPRADLMRTWVVGPFALVTALALGPWEFPATVGLPFLVIPALALVGMRLGTFAAAWAVFMVAVLVETTTAVGVGPFAAQGQFHGLVVAQMYLATCATAALAVSALMSGYVSRGELALTDPLTGLANRRLLFDRVGLACRQLQRRPGHVALMFVDLDGFKTVNDERGHEAGDRVLAETAARLRAVVRDEDTVARLGGDEFVVLLSHVEDPALLPELADRVEKAVTAPVPAAGEAVAVGASVGLAWTRDPAADTEALLGEADDAMYAIKRLRAARAILA